MNHADLSLRFRENAADGLGKSIQIIGCRNQNIFHLELSSLLKQSSKTRTFVLFQATFQELLSFHHGLKPTAR